MSVEHSAAESSPAPSLPSLQTHDAKSPTAFRTISEVADDLKLPQHVLRFWESKFQQIKPLKRGGGRRYYRPDDIRVIHRIKELLYSEGFTIKGVQKLLREGEAPQSLARSKVAQPQLPMGMLPMTQSVSAPAQTAIPLTTLAARQGNLTPELKREMEGVLAELRAMRKILHQSGI